LSVRPEHDPRLDDTELVEALESSRRLGMLGSAPIADVIAHSSAFLAPLADVSGTVVDLGSGGGVPGLVIAWMRPDLHVVVVDRRVTRTDHLQRLVRRLRLTDRVDVLATDTAALPQLLDGPVDAVVARGFGTPDAVLEAAAPILAPGGVLIVAEPPQDRERWTHAADAAALVRVPWVDQRVAVLRHVPR
jgi:16S rRNA (guanine527-N7)-methyltransferase